MHPHSSSYPLDSLSQSSSLGRTILASSAPQQISASLDAIAAFLHPSLPPDHSRHFFSLSFPSFISALFAFHDTSSPSWLHVILSSNDAVLADKLFSLLSPSGLLLRAVSAVDRLSLVKYVFPVERLPDWARSLLSSDDDDVTDLAPIFKNRVKPDPAQPNSRQLHLNVFEYFIFWFVYYPVCRGNAENTRDAVSVSTSRNRFKFENWVSSLSGFANPKRGGDSEIKIECSVYARLLYSYLNAYVAVSDLDSRIMYGSSILQCNLGFDSSEIAKGEFLVNTLTCFWLLDNEFSPILLSSCKMFGVRFQLRSVLGETPPTAGLGEVVKLLVKYLNSGLVMHYGNESDNVGYGASLRRGMSGSFDVAVLSPGVLPNGSWNLVIQRPLYRFILRTFLFCPVGASIKNISEVFSVWVAYLEPWAISFDEFRELDGVGDGASKKGIKEDLKTVASGYSASWEAYVLANYLYYSSLVLHFIGFAHKFLLTDAEIIVQMVSKVLAILTSSKGLLDLMKTMDTAFHSKQAGTGKSRLNSLYRFVTPIREQLNDWEDGLCESDADGSFLHDNWNKDLRLFSNGEDGGQHLLQLFILRAEAELQAISGGTIAANLQCIDSLKDQVACLFGNDAVKRLSFSPEVKQPAQPREEIFKPRRVGNRALADIKYKDDWMKRPISDDEVAWLAKLLVLLSCWLNGILGLNQAESNQVGSAPTYVKVPPSDISGTKAVFGAVGSRIVSLAEGVVKLVRKQNLRVNLRVLASKKVVMVLLLCVVYSILKRLWTFIW